MGGGKGGNTTTSNFKPPEAFMKAYQESLNMARDAANQPYKQYQGDLVAGLTPTQLQGIANVNAAQGMALPSIQKGMDYTQQAAKGITPGLYNKFYSPYVKDVANATQANLLESGAQQMSGLKSGAIQAGAFGGDRGGVAQAEMARQQQLSNAMAMSNIYNQGYGQAMGLAGQQVSNLGAMGQQMAALGAGAQGSVLQGAQAQMAAGAQQQATKQAELSSAYEQWMQRQAYPYQQAQFFANIAQGLGAGAGGTSSTTTPAPNIWSQLFGGIGAIGSIFSDKRLKENIQAVGKLNDGQTIYRYNFKGDPKTQIGLLAQEVEEQKPGAVTQVKGLKMVDYRDATEDSAKMSSMGGVVAPGMDRQGLAGGGIPFYPYEDARTYVPEGKIGGKGSTIPDAPRAFEDKGLSGDWSEIMPLSQGQISGLRKLAGDIGLELPTKEESGYASGGVAGRGHYQDGGMENVPEDEVEGLAAVPAPEFEPPAGLVAAESGGDFAARNPQGYVGRLQFGPDRLTDAKRAGVIPAEMTAEQFRRDPETQKATEAWHLGDTNDFIDKSGLAAVEGKTIKGIPVTRDGLVNVAHLGGKPGLQKFVSSGGEYDPADANGTRLSDYLAMASEGGVAPVSAEPEPSGLAAASPSASSETDGLVIKGQKPGLKFDLGKIFANEDSPSMIERVMGRRLSPEARSAVMNASFALMAGRSPFFFTNLGEAGKVGTQTYYNALGQKAELASKQAETQRKVFEIQKANAEFYGPIIQDAMLRNNGILPENMKPLIEKMGPFAQAYVSSAMAPIYSPSNRTDVPQNTTIPEAAAPVPPSATESRANAPETTPSVVSTTEAESSELSIPVIPSVSANNQPFADKLSDPAYLAGIVRNPNVPYATRMAAKQRLEIATEKLAKDNGIYIGQDGKPHAYAGWQEIVAQQEGLKTRASEAAKSEYDLVEVIDPETNRKIKIPRSEAIKNQNITELSPAEKIKAEESTKADVGIVSELSKQMSDMQSGFSSRTMIVDGMRDSLSAAETGKFAELKTDIVNAMNSFGLANADMVEEAADLQTAMKFFAQSILDSGMKDKIGPQISNADLTLVAKGQGTIENLPAANRRIIGAMYGKLLYDKAKAEAWDEYVTEKGGIQNISATDSRKWQREFGEDNPIGKYVQTGIAMTPVAGELSVKRPPSYFKEGYQYVDPKNGRVFIVKGFKKIGEKTVPDMEYVQ